METEFRREIIHLRLEGGQALNQHAQGVADFAIRCSSSMVFGMSERFAGGIREDRLSRLL